MGNLETKSTVEDEEDDHRRSGLGVSSSLPARARDAATEGREERPSTSSSYSGSGGGPVIELVNASLLRPDRSYAPLSTEDPGGSSTGAAVVGLPPAWVDVSEEIAADMQRARTKMSELVKAHAKALMPSFGDDKEDQHAIKLLTYEITDVLKRSEKRLQKLSSSDPSEDSNVRKNVQRSLATDLQNLSMEFRKKQSSYLKRLQQQQEGFNDIQMSALKRSEVFTREREREIVQVVESVNELAQIMKDLSVLVIDQAERTQRKGGMVMCATVLVILIFIMLVLLILKTILL
ncbi:hypothetical protein C4D60_Mb10t21970 [Musa balbisiana]|uniref:Syntaxin N-terminal domain-containing protein n=1 Tax=Musa balbisiana TaxID=52838 RepID=A0A4S8IYT7_MUSBA|nr:hypothetical protein C4D60_Mb10t21970 [Musa balbisiana]